MSIVGAALVGLGLDVLFGKLDGPAAQWANLADTAARETLGLLPNLVPGGQAGFRSLLSITRRFIRALSSFWYHPGRSCRSWPDWHSWGMFFHG